MVIVIMVPGNKENAKGILQTKSDILGEPHWWISLFARIWFPTHVWLGRLLSTQQLRLRFSQLGCGWTLFTNVQFGKMALFFVMGTQPFREKVASLKYIGMIWIKKLTLEQKNMAFIELL
jgi:hypothetical protein